MSDRITKSIIVKGDPATVFGLWAEVTNFPRFMKYVKSVSRVGDWTSRWVVEGPMGKDVHWDAEMTTYEPDRRIAWNTKGINGGGDGDIKTSGQVTFAPLAHNETEVTVTMQFTPPAGALGEAVAKVFANPEKRVEEDLRNFKVYAEGRSGIGN